MPQNLILKKNQWSRSNSFETSSGTVQLYNTAGEDARNSLLQVQKFSQNSQYRAFKISFGFIPHTDYYDAPADLADDAPLFWRDSLFRLDVNNQEIWRNTPWALMPEPALFKVAEGATTATPIQSSLQSAMYVTEDLGKELYLDFARGQNFQFSVVIGSQVTSLSGSGMQPFAVMHGVEATNLGDSSRML